MNILYFVNYLSKGRGAWLFLALCLLGFEGAALYFQHGMGLQPCVMCIYERVAMLSILFAALIACIKPRWLIFRLIGLIGWGYGAYRGLMLAMEHVGYQFNTSGLGGNCAIFAKFPKWAPLNEWVPWMFNPTGDCSKIVWRFFGYSMPQCLVVIFAVLLAVMIIVALSQLFNVERDDK